MRNFQIVDMSVFAMKDPMPKQRVVNDGLKVAVDGYHVPQNEVGRAVLMAAIAEDRANGFVPGATKSDYDHMLTCAIVCPTCGAAKHENCFAQAGEDHFPGPEFRAMREHQERIDAAKSDPALVAMFGGQDERDHRFRWKSGVRPRPA